MMNVPGLVAWRCRWSMGRLARPLMTSTTSLRDLLRDLRMGSLIVRSYRHSPPCPHQRPHFQWMSQLKSLDSTLESYPHPVRFLSVLALLLPSNNYEDYFRPRRDSEAGA
jgi:hypothetical protein